MSRVRRHLLAIACATLGVQTLVVALGAARVCWPGEHMHGGVPVDDCPMHHHQGTEANAHHASHSAGHAAHGQPAGGDHAPRGLLTCRCSNELPGVFTGAPGVIPAATLIAVPGFTIAAAFATAAPTWDVLFPPLSPPPRLLSFLVS